MENCEQNQVEKEKRAPSMTKIDLSGATTYGTSVPRSMCREFAVLPSRLPQNLDEFQTEMAPSKFGHAHLESKLSKQEGKSCEAAADRSVADGRQSPVIQTLAPGQKRIVEEQMKFLESVYGNYEA